MRRESFVLRVESARMNFGARTDAEAEWHAEWKRKAAAWAEPLERALVGCAERPELRPWDRTLPLHRAVAGVRPRKGPCRHVIAVLALGLGGLDVAFARCPTEAELAALNKAVGAAALRAARR